MKGHRFFRSVPFEFETIRALWYCCVNGADYGEVISAVTTIRDGDFDSWYQGWAALALALSKRAETLKDVTSAGKALLRASNYMRTAEFFLMPDDARRTESSRYAQDTFYAGLQRLGIAHTRDRIDFGNGQMETLFFPARAPAKQTTFVVHGGFDSTPEELYFTIAAAATERGYDVLIFEGPGQGNLLRRYAMPMIPEWERAASVAINSLSLHCEPRRIIGVGISLGGHLLARAAAFEPRYDGIVMFDFFPNPIEAFKSTLPRALHASFERMPGWLAAIIGFGTRIDANLRWLIHNAKWVFGAQDLQTMIAKIRQFDASAWLDRVKVPTLMMVGEREHFFPPALADEFYRKLPAKSKRLRVFTQREGGHLHCRNGALQLAHEEVFSWVAEQTDDTAAVSK
jgi:pimeloyl-ACP methyl ester carboxylesterase